MLHALGMAQTPESDPVRDALFKLDDIPNVRVMGLLRARAGHSDLPGRSDLIKNGRK
eukprot:COSAG02_NODE_690_length_18450_cov_6.643017_4_plen_57_part_00